MIECIVFDFDGTLRQSLGIKHQAYYSAVYDVLGGEALFRDIIREFPGITRYSGCAIFAERARALGIDCPDGEELAARYTRVCEDAIAACSEVPGATRFLDWLRGRAVDCFVVSGTPQLPLRDTIRRIGLVDSFVDILGYPVTKPQHYADVLERVGCPPGSLLAIGDGDDDKAAAESVGGLFVRVSGGAGSPQPDEWVVESLEQIREIAELKFPTY
ncbi:MAG: hypothetical protein CFH10_00502 [Alphaproteobacteria bacterium MarineAlpha4_Bin2]|nr:MAG: hypothetical protein CFH10_00502 [Alphaproteobacteria bacterium MarineAlpha4_Bin2]